MTVYDREVLDAIRYIGKELREIRKVLEKEKAPAHIIISKAGIVAKGKDVLPDLETYFERLEDDSK